MSERDMFLGCTFEDATRNVVVPAGTYTVRVLDGAPHKGKEPNPALSAEAGGDVYMRTLNTQLKIIGSPEAKYEGVVLRNHFCLLGKMKWTAKYAMEQAAMDDVLRYFDPNRPDYVGGTDEAPVLPPLGSDDYWEMVSRFFLCGEMTDVNGRLFSSTNGGLIGKDLVVSIGKPAKNKQSGEEETGGIFPQNPNKG